MVRFCFFVYSFLHSVVVYVFDMHDFFKIEILMRKTAERSGVMYRREIYKASGNEIKQGIIISMVVFVMFTLAFMLSKSKMVNLEGGIIYFLVTFLVTWNLYMMVGHDILFDNVKTMRCCIIDCELNWELLEIFLGKKKKGKMPIKGFNVWAHEIDSRGHSSAIVYEPDRIYDFPAKLNLKSGNFDLYYEIEKLRKKHIKFHGDDKKAENFLYGEITYVEKSGLIVGFEYFGTKKYA